MTPRIAVLGVGLIGGSIGLAARERLGARVAGHDLDPAVRERALALGALDSVHEDAGEACADAEIVFCAAPVGSLPDLVEAALSASGPEVAITDVGSTKRGLVERFGADPRFIGGHPLAGAETAGVEHARADLFDGARWYLTPTGTSGGLLYDRLQRALSGIGARPEAIEAEAHDRVLATVSHLPHVLANVLVNQAAETLAEGREGLPSVGPSFRDTTRVAGANLGIWRDIFLSNRDAIVRGIDATVERLGDARQLIADGDAEGIGAWIEAAREDRRRLLERELTGGPVHELRVTVPNQPGVVAEIALALGRAAVNIEDMALYPTPDMSSGAVTLWVAGDEAATRAEELVEGLGLRVTRVGHR